MKTCLRVAIFGGLPLLLCACEPAASDKASALNDGNITAAENLSAQTFGRLSYEDQVHQASALLVIRYDIDHQGNVTPVVTHRKSRVGEGSPPFKVGDVYMTATQQFLIESIGSELRHLGEGAVILFQGQPPAERASRFIHDGNVSGRAPVPVEVVLAGFDGAPIANGSPAEVLTLEPDFENGESGASSTTVGVKDKAILVDILERRGLRYQVEPQNNKFIVGWVGTDEEVDAVMEEFVAACD